MSCPIQMSVAAYALGTLDPEERATVAEHLPTCASCRATLDSVSDLPDLLARVRSDEVVVDKSAADERMFERLLQSALRERRRRRSRVLAVAAAAVILVSGTGIGIAVALREAPSSHSGRVVAAAQGPVHARVWLHPSMGGTRLTLELSGVPAEQRCRLVAVDGAGHRQVAATWEATYEGRASITGSTDIPADQLTWLVVETTDNQRLVRLPVRS